ncbi:MAG: hypothetical protein KBD04_06130 [Proteobacteria bacterium]|nr:hypothetical protein [Pseudomonadota bacterium]
MNKLIALAIIIVGIQEGFTSTSQDSVEKIAPEGVTEKLSGADLLQEDEGQIAILQAKLEELKKENDDGKVIEAYIELAREMESLNNERHALHNAVRGFEKAVGIFSEKIKSIIQKVNNILKTQSEVAINNAKVAKLLQPPLVSVSSATSSNDSAAVLTDEAKDKN